MYFQTFAQMTSLIHSTHTQSHTTRNTQHATRTSMHGHGMDPLFAQEQQQSRCEVRYCSLEVHHQLRFILNTIQNNPYIGTVIRKPLIGFPVHHKLSYL